MPNIFRDLPTDPVEGRFDTLATSKSVRVERVFSNGHTTRRGKWYDQSQSEWVLVLDGCGKIEFEGGRRVTLQKRGRLLVNPNKRTTTPCRPHRLEDPLASSAFSTKEEAHAELTRGHSRISRHRVSSG